MPTFLSPLIKGAPACAIVNTRNEAVLAEHVLPAFDSKTRRQGLLGRDSLPDGYALVIAPSSAVHTFFMRFAIDIVFVGRDGRVLKTRSRVGPWRMCGSLRAFAVIELPAGTIDRTRTIRGDVLAVKENPDG